MSETYSQTVALYQGERQGAPYRSLPVMKSVYDSSGSVYAVRIAGAIFFIVYSTIWHHGGPLIGASAAILAVVVATAWRMPDFKMNLFVLTAQAYGLCQFRV